jgi:metal-responsive CopG/Arc/MetJ family transcriptional regulator
MPGGEKRLRNLVMLSESVVEKLDAEANRQGLSRSGLIRWIVLRYLSEKERE